LGEGNVALPYKFSWQKWSEESPFLMIHGCKDRGIYGYNGQNLFDIEFYVVTMDSSLYSENEEHLTHNQ